MKNIKIISISALFMMLTTQAFAGSAPKGKPFVALQGQIIEVQGAVAEIDTRMTELETSVAEQLSAMKTDVEELAIAVGTLTGRVDTLDDAVVLNEFAITNLESRNVQLTNVVNDIAAGVSTLEGEVATLKNADIMLQAAITSGDATLLATIDANTATLQAAINAGNTTLQEAIDAGYTSLQSQLDVGIVSLQDAIAANQIALTNSIAAGDASLQLQIDANSKYTTDLEVAMADNAFNLQSIVNNNSDLISALESQITELNASLQTKQDIINGVCPEGSAIYAVDSRGSVSCTIAGGSSNFSQVQVRAWGSSQHIRTSSYYNSYQRRWYYNYYYSAAKAYATCPEGYSLTGGGDGRYINNATQVRWSSSHPATEGAMYDTAFQDLANDPDKRRRTWAVHVGRDDGPYAGHALAVALCIK